MESATANPATATRGRPDSMTDHRPVMLDEVVAGLAPRPGGVIVDGTFGRGGHSAALLAAIGPTGVLHALDRDPQACHAAWTRFGATPNFRIHRRNFGDVGALVSELGLTGKVDGLLLDLGVSSPQFDDATRGFSFSADGPLDMRMDPGSGESAAAWIARAKEAEIADVLWTYGEERASRRIARRIVDARQETPIATTAQLATIIQRALPGPRQKIHPATRSFQAIRIFINGELDALNRALEASLTVLAPGGRLAVISFHSLEDRIVKRFIREAAHVPADAPPHTNAKLQPVDRVFPGDEEVQQNPRARSAVLRIAERLP
jgi:16S rRNA (cytosine1402-N4)-methyltransferase